MASRKKAGKKKVAKKKTTKKKASRKVTPRKKKAPVDALLGLEPDRLPLTARRAEHVARLAGVESKELRGKTVGEVAELLKWKVAPELLLFRRICGRVVKRDPVTGELHPVPNATVHVEDTDCTLLGYFPVESPWAWILPVSCSREEIATVRTDDCGEFCVYLPFWDIDRILRWRRGKLCYWDFFRPRLRDLLELEPDPSIFRPPIPLPDPPPFRAIRDEGLERIRDLVGESAAQRLEAARDRSVAGESETELEELLDQPAFPEAVPPPLPQELVAGKTAARDLAETLSLDPEALPDLDSRLFLGPFWRCRDIVIGLWETFFDVPDITFRVTQDYDGDGVEETIYSESFFEVRWNSGSIPDVTLEASGNALSVPHCGPVQEIPCGNVPSIESAGYLDLEPAYHSDVDGYGQRVNRFSIAGLFPPPPSDAISVPAHEPANAPYHSNLNLHGCVRMLNATHYRLRYSYRPTPADPFGPMLPFLGVIWSAPRQGPGAPVPFVPDGDGWYPIQPAGILVHPNWLFPWNTRLRPGGTYQIEVQLGQAGGGSINLVSTSAARTFEVDNGRPTLSLTEVRWRPAGTIGPWDDTNSTVVIPTPVANTCPIIERPTGTDIHLRVLWSAASKHLRDASLFQHGCGGGGMLLLDVGPETPAIENYRRWHTGPADNNVSQTNRYLLPSYRPPGCYSVGIVAHSRAFNPQDFDAASTKDWWVNQGNLYSRMSRAISVVDV